MQDFTAAPIAVVSTHGAFSDADFAANPDNRKSVSGHVYMLGGGPIAWHSKKLVLPRLGTPGPQVDLAAPT